METLSKTKIDRLGDRLRKGNLTDDDLRLLDEYRRSFAGAYDAVVGTIRQQLGLEPTGRPAKSTTSIAEKLHRESIRLTQIQDIAGCRLIVSDIAEQDRVKRSLKEIFHESIVIDRRQKPSHGYRAVHVIAATEGKAVEIQLRTALQQGWAELSEKLADVIDPAIKYGGGEQRVRQVLSIASLVVATEEANESILLEIQGTLNAMFSEVGLTEERRIRIMELQTKMASVKAQLDTSCKDTLDALRYAVQEFTDPAGQE